MTNSNHECVNMPLTNKIFEFQSNSPGSFPSLCCYLLYFRFSVKFIHFESKHSLTSRCVRVKNGFCCVFYYKLYFTFVSEIIDEQQYHVVLMGLELVGSDLCFGWWGSWAWVVHGWCMAFGAWRLVHGDVTLLFL